MVRIAAHGTRLATNPVGASASRRWASRHAPRLPNGSVATCHADVTQVRRSPELPIVANQKLPAPDGAVGAETGAVERDPNDRLDKAVLRHAARHVGMMMLYRGAARMEDRGWRMDDRTSASILHPPSSIFFLSCFLLVSSSSCIAGRRIIGVQIVGNHFRLDSKELLVENNVFLERPESVVMIEIAQMMAQKSMPVTPQGKSPFELATDRQNRTGAGERQRDRLRSIATRVP